MEDLNLGSKIRGFRKTREMSIKKLSEISGVTSSMLSQIERDVVNPSINTLKAIALALDVPMYRFFKEDEENQELLVRKNSRKMIGFPENQDVRYELLTANVNGSIEFCMMTIPSHSASVDKPQNHIGEEVALVLEGMVDILISDRRFSLNTGDSISIPAQSDHKWENFSNVPVRVVFAVTPPSF